MKQSLKSARNLSLECCKLIAACFVVFLHIPLPGQFGQWVVCLSRFAVPLFFAVSGWFSFGAAPEKLKKRFGHILLLELLGDLLYVSWRVVSGWYWGESLYWCLRYQLPDIPALKLWLFWNVDPFAGHLWYLSATCLCYLVLWAYTRRGRKDYRPLYLTGLILLLGCFAMGEFSRFTGIRVDYRVSRSGLFTGLPIFLLGLFLREHRQKLTAWGFPLLAGGVLLSILEWKRFGVYDLYTGSVLTAASVLLLTARYPAVPRRLTGAASGFGSVSTVVYLLHLLLLDVSAQFFQTTLDRLGELGLWLQPLLVLAASLVLGFCWNGLRKLVCKTK